MCWCAVKKLLTHSLTCGCGVYVLWARHVQLERMWAWLIPILKSVLVNFTIESLNDWGTCFATASVCFLICLLISCSYFSVWGHWLIFQTWYRVRSSFDKVSWFSDNSPGERICWFIEQLVFKGLMTSDCRNNVLWIYKLKKNIEIWETWKKSGQL